MRVLLVLVLCLAAAYGQIDLQLDMSTDTDVIPGTNVTLMCRVTGLEDGSFIYWYKAVRQITGPLPEPMAEGQEPPKDGQVNEVYEQIATSDILLPFYRELNNYVATKTTVGDAKLFVLNIYNVSDSESGHYGCWAPQDDNAYGTLELRVIEPPTEIYFVNHTDANNMTFIEGQHHQVICHVGASLPSPGVKLSIGHDAEGWRDVTRLFTRHTKLNVNCDEAAGGASKTCPLNMDYDTHMMTVSSPNSWEPTFKDEGRFLKCETAYPDTPLFANVKPISTQIKIDLHYSPKFDCEMTQYVKKNAMEAKIMCKTHFNPTPTGARWSFTIGRQSYELNFNETKDNFKAEQFVMDEAFGEEHEREYSLTITSLGTQHLTNYKLEVANTLGTNSTTIRLSEEKPPTIPPAGSGSAAIQWSLLTLFTTMAAILKF